MSFIETRRRFLLASAAALAATACGVSAPVVTSPPGPLAPSLSRKVVIVGGGLSGLAIAFYLLERGFDPTVLEASLRPGGRILTLREPFQEGLHVEAGATHVLPDPDLLKLMAAVGVVVDPRRPRQKGLSQIVLTGDKRRVLGPGEEAPEEHPLSPEELALGPFGPMKKYFALVKDIDPTQPLPASLLQYDAMNAAEFLQKQGASPGYMEGVHGAFAPDEPLAWVSALSLMREVANFQREIALQGPGGRIHGGSDVFPAAIAERLGQRVVYDAHVVKIEQTAAGVRVSFIRRGETSTIEAGRAVCALPSTVLGNVAISPALSAEKQRAIRELTMVSVARVWLTSKQRFWTARNESGNVESDAPLGNLRDETDQQDGTRGILGVYATGAEARRLAAMSAPERHQTVLDYGERAHPGLKDNLAGSASKCWDDDPLQRGAYAHFKPGQLTTLVPELARAEGRVHFAGDQTSFRPGFMHGALGSARRVVEEIVRAG
jgi:monoamine oxidase